MEVNKIAVTYVIDRLKSFGGEPAALSDLLRAAIFEAAFQVKLLAHGDKIQAIKEIRYLTGCGLAEAKNFIEATPRVLPGAFNRAQADNMANGLRSVGCDVTIEPAMRVALCRLVELVPECRAPLEAAGVDLEDK